MMMSGFGSDMEGICEYTVNKQSRSGDKGWSWRLGNGRGPNKTPHYKKQLVTKCYTGPL